MTLRSTSMSLAGAAILAVAPFSIPSIAHAEPQFPVFQLQAQTPPPSQTPPPGTRVIPSMRGGFLGIGIQQLTPERAKALKLREDAGGVEVTRVGQDSPADKAGLKPGDVILQYGGTNIENLEQFSRLVRETPVGREVKLDISRNGAPQTLTAKIGVHPVPQFSTRDPRDGFPPNFPDIPRVFLGSQSPMLGVEVQAVDGQLAQYFGVKEGVLVRSVMKNSAAEKAGIKAGDVIVRLEETPVTTPSEIMGRLHAMAGKQASIVVMRDRKEVTLGVTLDALPDGGISRWDR